MVPGTVENYSLTTYRSSLLHLRAYQLDFSIAFFEKLFLENEFSAVSSVPRRFRRENA